MKKRIFLAAVLLCCLLLAGCHGSKGLKEFEVPGQFDETRQYELVFWAKNDTNKAQTDIYRETIEDFEKLYPNIHVNLRLYTDYGRIYNDVITNISTNTTPNVCITYPDHIATYMAGDNVVVPLDAVAADGAYGLGGSRVAFDSVTKEEIVPQFLDECRINGELYSLPYMRSTEACYINKTYVEKLGYTVPDVLTWDFIWEVSEAATAKDAEGNFTVNGQKVMLPFIYKSTDNMMIQLLRQNGYPYSDADGTVGLFNDGTKELLYTIAGHAKSEAFSTFKISGYPANFLNAGQCIFAVDSTAGSTWMGSHAPLLDISEDRLVEFETEVRTVPQADPSNPCMISQGPSLCLFNKEDPQEVLASWLFMQYLLTSKVQIAYSETEGYVPVTKRAQESPEYLEYLAACGSDGTVHYDVKLKAVQLLLDNTDRTFVTPVFNGSASLRDGAGQLIENVTKSVRRKETVDEAYMDRLYSDVISLYRLDRTSPAGGVSTAQKELGEMPAASIVLLAGLAAVWLVMGVFVLISRIKKKDA